MKIQFVSAHNLSILDPITRQGIFADPSIWAECSEYKNKITNESDPIITYTPKYFIHLSDILNIKNWNVRTGDGMVRTPEEFRVYFENHTFVNDLEGDSDVAGK